MRSGLFGVSSLSSLALLARAVPRIRWFWSILCALAGGLQAIALAWPLQAWTPPGFIRGEPSGALQIASLALLVMALRNTTRARLAMWRAWLFATAWLTGTFWWLFISMHTYGGLPASLAALAVVTLAGSLALYYALAAGLWVRWAPRSPLSQGLLFAALWTLAELLRGRCFTGFPWGASGYAQVNLMAAWAPWVGVYGMGAVATLLAYSLGACRILGVDSENRSQQGPVLQPTSQKPDWLPGALAWLRSVKALRSPTILFFTLLWLSVVSGSLWRELGQRDTSSVGSLHVWLLQGNIPQNQKFESDTGLALAQQWYPQQIAHAVQAATNGSAKTPLLVVSPETALPLLPQQTEAELWRALLHPLAQPGEAATPVAALLGLPLGNVQTGYTNSALGIAPNPAAYAAMQLTDHGTAVAVALERAGFYRYDKHHLVPFGEFIPPFFRWFVDLLQMPLGNFERGALPQPTWVWAGQRLAANICYEDLFGEELAASFRDPAHAPTVLVNLSNIAWFGNTVAIDQHLNISRLRALELGRPMLRATNTGATAVIDHRGQVTHALPRLTRGHLTAEVDGRRGLTPYARWASRWGLWPVWGLCLSVVAAPLILRGRERLS